MVQKLRTFPRDKGHSSDKSKKDFQEEKVTVQISGIPRKNYTKALRAAQIALEPFKYSM